MLPIFGTAVLALGGWTVRMLWRLAQSLQQDHDVIQANTDATQRLTRQMGALTERVARLEGPPGNANRRR